MNSSLRAEVPQSPEVPKTNIQLMQILIGEMGLEIAGNILHNDSIALQCHSGDESWIIQNALTSSLKALGYQVFVDSSSRPRILAKIQPVNLAVHYDESFRDGFLGTRNTRRTISVELNCLLSNRTTGEVYYSGSPKREFADTVAVGDIPAIETSTVRSTHAELPSETFLDRIIEPVVLIGATGVAVYLFFHIRS